MNRGISWPALWLGIIGFGILYVPVVVMVIYSFNASRLVSVWAGFSTKWYGELMQNDQVLAALGKSLWVAVNAATLSTVFGVLIALAFVRYGNFRFRLLLSALASTPLVMPEVVTGLSLLLLFIAMEGFLGWPAGRGLDTIIIAHTTFGMCFAAVVVQSRLRDFDMSIEEAASDLGATQPFIFFSITLPIIAPAVIAAWLLAFTLSFDDLVIASFVSGPGSSTLPIVVFSKVRLGVTPEINALATIMIALVAASVVAASIIIYRNAAGRAATEEKGSQP
ncbi:MAG: putrescine ABC transporter permease PotI [SAR116 cluster bacterium]|jgi:putrescine transport system permease protein|nr:putrescine ABC transporter permease PotI [SAR116 cluster bacterium]RPG98302.1 MAG: ABC transporter permease subunit [Candidatus Puniceispirillum sp. TMED176]RZO29501.1 MAG: ABC transporter permease subunit [SAR116 cluster bacterium]|tara:strand:+ start:8374 stop:9210 length:837 start_codon:yes stop_codon:yes gene_type:complete